MVPRKLFHHCFQVTVVLLVTSEVYSQIGENQGWRGGLPSTLKNTRQDPHLQRPMAVHQKVLRYYREKGVLTSAIPELKLLSPIFQGKRRPSNDRGPSGEDLGIKWDVSQLIRHASPKFEPEIHKVRTNDSYILTLYRIRNKACRNRTAVPVFFQHGFLGSAADWLLLDPDFSFPLILAASGQDVWLGNQYSQEHANMTSKDPKYWDFSFHEMGKYDLSAAFDYIFNVTGKKKLDYVGYELGTTMFYICLSLFPDKYNPKIQTMIGLGPTAYISRSQSPIKHLAPLVHFYGSIIKDGPLIPSSISSFLRFFQPKLCEIQKHGRSLCSDTLALIFGADENEVISKQVVSRVFGHMPETTSIKTFIHFLQLLNHDDFRQFDYGFVKNLLTYNETTPPKYNIFLIQVLTLNYYGEQDLLLDRKDVEQTASELGTASAKVNVELMEFEHTGFIYSEYFIMSNGENFDAFLFCRELSQEDESMCVEPNSTPPAGKTSTLPCKCRGQCLT